MFVDLFFGRRGVVSFENGVFNFETYLFWYFQNYFCVGDGKFWKWLKITLFHVFWIIFALKIALLTSKLDFFHILKIDTYIIYSWVLMPTVTILGYLKFFSLFLYYQY